MNLTQRACSAEQFAEITTNCRRATLSLVARYNKDGVEGLKEKPGCGRHSKLPVSEYKRLCSRIDVGPADENEVASFCGKSIQRIFSREVNVLFGLNGVYQLLYGLGYSYLAPQPRHEKADPQVQQHFQKPPGEA